MKELTIFGRKCRYDDIVGTWDAKDDIRVLDELIAQVQAPITLTGEPEVFEVANDYHGIDGAFDKWIRDNYRHEGDSMTKCFLRLGVEDKEFLRMRNEGLNDIYYHKVTLYPEIVERLLRELNLYKAQVQAIYDELQADYERKMAEREARRKQYEVVKVYKDVKPRGGEDGVDGVFDADYRDTETGEIIRFVSLDMFDIGCPSVPKRYQGTDDAITCVNWTESEKKLRKWLSEFGPFKGIRM